VKDGRNGVKQDEEKGGIGCNRVNRVRRGRKRM
jgi:hypothetical protein